MGLFDAISAPFQAVGSTIGGGVGGITKGVMDSSGATDTFHVDNPYSANDLAAALTNYNNTYNNQNALAEALKSQAMNGNGPVQALVNKNIQSAMQQAAVSNAQNRAINPGLAARLSGQQAVSGMSNAAGLGAQAQLESQSGLSGMYNNMANQNINQQNEINRANLAASEINAGTAKQNSQTAGQITGSLFNAAGAAAGHAAAHGAYINGKASVPGDSPKNDTVPIMVSPGEIVLPRSVVQSDDAGDKAKEFVEHLKKGKSKEKSGGYAKVLEAHRRLGEALKGMKAS